MRGCWDTKYPNDR